MKLSQLVPARKEAEVVFVEGQSGLKISFNGNVKYRDIARMAETGKKMQAGDQSAIEESARFLEFYSLEWDLEDDDGNPIPATAEAILDLPAEVAGEIFRTVVEAVAPKSTPETESQSVATPSTETGSGTSQTNSPTG
jgi:hypothetical protein